MVISSFISSILVLMLGIWAYMKLESSMNIVAEKQLLIEPSKFSYKMWKDMPVTMYQSFTFFNLTNWNQVKAVGQKPRFIEVGPYVYRTIWTKSDINFMDDEKLVSFSERKQWIFQPHLSKGSEDDQIWTINTPLMTALALIQNAPVITRNIVSVILDGLGEGAFIKRNIRSLLFEGYSDLIVSVGPLFDRRFANFNGKFAYLYNKNDSVDGIWTISTGLDNIANLNKITRFQSNIVNMTSFSSNQPPQGLNEVKAECASAWSLDQATNGQLFAPFNKDIIETSARQQQVSSKMARSSKLEQVTQAPPGAKRFFSRSANHDSSHHQNQNQNQELIVNPFFKVDPNNNNAANLEKLKDVGKFIFYPDLCRPVHLLPSKQQISTPNGIQASRYYIDPRVFMNSSQVPTNKCFEMNPRPALANALAATISSVTGANVAMPNLVVGASSPFAMFSPSPSHHHHHHNHHNNHHNHQHNNNHHHNEPAGLFERSNHPTSSFLNNALHTLSAVSPNLGGGASSDSQASGAANGAPISRLGRVRQLFSNIVSQRMSVTNPSSLLPSLTAGPAAGLLAIGNHFNAAPPPPPPSAVGTNSRNSPDEPISLTALNRQLAPANTISPLSPNDNFKDALLQGSQAIPVQAAPPPPPAPPGGSDRWITQFRFKWPRGVFSIGQCQLGAPIYASLPHFLDADEYYLEQVDGLKPNRSLHEFYIDIESTLNSIPVGAKARLQLNVATPELRFRNIPNAMIPVLWQEVTFSIDKPVATMLYWSVTMSPTIYKLISILLLAAGSILLAISLLNCFRRNKNRVEASSLPVENDESGGICNRPAERKNEAKVAETQPETYGGQGSAQGFRSIWRRHPLKCNNHNNSRACHHSSADCSLDNDIRHHGAALNEAFNAGSCAQFCSHSSKDCISESGSDESLRRQQLQNFSNDDLQHRMRPASGGSSSGSPKQPSSRASSHCELVSSLSNANNASLNCAGCLLACLRHSPPTNNHIHDHHLVQTSTSDNSTTVRLQQHQLQHQPCEKSTLSSRSGELHLDSCSSIYNNVNKSNRTTFK